MGSDRSYKFDNLKFFLICCVCLGHLAGHYTSNLTVQKMQFWVYLFHMPAFIFIAGLFSKKTVDNKRWNRIIPYLFVFILMGTLEYMAYAWLRGIGNVELELFTTDSIPWYAISMLLWYTFTILAKDVKPTYVLSVSILLAIVVGYANDVGSFLALRRTIVFFPFFYVGYIIDISKLLAFLNKIYIRIFSVIIIISSIVIVALEYDKTWKKWRSLFRGKFAFSEINKNLPYEWGFLWRLGAYIVSAILVLALISIMPNVKSVISWLGKRTLSVFVFHGVTVYLATTKFTFINDWVKAGNLPLRMLLLTLAIVVLTSLPIFEWPVRKLMTVPARNTENKSSKKISKEREMEHEE